MRINQWPPDFRVRLRKQLFHRYFHKSRIGIVLISIRHGQLHNFGNGVDVVRREQSHFLEVKSFQQADSDSGESQERRLGHREKAEQFYHDLKSRGRRC